MNYGFLCRKFSHYNLSEVMVYQRASAYKLALFLLNRKLLRVFEFAERSSQLSEAQFVIGCCDGNNGVLIFSGACNRFVTFISYILCSGFDRN